MLKTSRNANLRVIIAALTRSRPQMLSHLLRSIGALDLPDSAEVSCLIVENDVSPHSKAQVEAASPLQNGIRVDYALETEQGIPFGRNRAAKFALEAQADLLIFIDDDELADRAWLVELLRRYRNSDAVLIGGPVRIAPPVEGLGPIQRVMYRCLSDYYRKRERQAERRADPANGEQIRVVTNNWLAELTLFSKHGIWFDEAMRHTGGTDSKFCETVAARGLPIAWAPDAVVAEVIPRERLTFWYQVRRTRDQTNTAYLRNRPSSLQLLRQVFIKVPLRMIECVLLTVWLLPSRGRSLQKLARRLGWMVGTLASPLGYRSNLYRTTTGS